MKMLTTLNNKTRMKLVLDHNTYLAHCVHQLTLGL